MKFDRKGDIGFMEAMAGAMTVCIVMMVFVAYVVADQASSQQDQVNFDWSYIEGIEVQDSQAVIHFASDPIVFMESNDISGILFKTHPPSNSELGGFEKKFGNVGGTKYSERKLFSVTYGNEVLPVSIEVVIVYGS